MDEVRRVLQEIGASAVPQLLVFNKIDALEMERRPLHLVDRFEVDGVYIPRVFVSARSGEGLPELRTELAAIVRQAMPGQITPDYTGQPDDATP